MIRGGAFGCYVLVVCWWAGYGRLASFYGNVRGRTGTAFVVDSTTFLSTAALAARTRPGDYACWIEGFSAVGGGAPDSPEIEIKSPYGSATVRADVPSAFAFPGEFRCFRSNSTLEFDQLSELVGGPSGSLDARRPDLGAYDGAIRSWTSRERFAACACLASSATFLFERSGPRVATFVRLDDDVDELVWTGVGLQCPVAEVECVPTAPAGIRRAFRIAYAAVAGR